MSLLTCSGQLTWTISRVFCEGCGESGQPPPVVHGSAALWGGVECPQRAFAHRTYRRWNSCHCLSKVDGFALFDLDDNCSHGLGGTALLFIDCAYANRLLALLAFVAVVLSHKLFKKYEVGVLGSRKTSCRGAFLWFYRPLCPLLNRSLLF